MQGWDFLTLAQVGSMVFQRIGFPLPAGVATLTMRGVFAVAIVYWGMAYLRKPEATVSPCSFSR